MVTTTVKVDVDGVLVGGWVVNTSLDTLAGAMAEGVLGAVTGPSAASAAFRVYPVQAVVIWRLEKVATPETAAWEAVPANVPLQGLAERERVTVWVSPVTTLPERPSMDTA